MPQTAEPQTLPIPAAAYAGGLPVVSTELSPGEVLNRLSRLSKRGRLPGFESLRGADLFKVEAHGVPFDADLIATFIPGPVGGELRFRSQMHRKIPVLCAVLLIATVWPGVYFTDELIAQYLPGLWRPWVTYWWYLPLTAIPLPWVWAKMMRRSRTSIETSAREMIGRITGELQAPMSVP